MSQPFHSTPTPQYAYWYSRDVVEKFARKYARATVFLGNCWGLSAPETLDRLTHTFMVRNNRWNSVRDLIKWLSKYDRITKMYDLSYTDRQKYLTSVMTQCEDLVIFENKQLNLIDNAE